MSEHEIRLNIKATRWEVTAFDWRDGSYSLSGPDRGGGVHGEWCGPPVEGRLAWLTWPLFVPLMFLVAHATVWRRR